MKRNSVMGESRKLITPEIRRSVDLSIYVADRIFDILEKQHKTQRDLANTLGKSEAEISKWMQGTHNFTLNTIAKIESVLGEHIFETSDITKQKEYKYIFIPLNAKCTYLSNINISPKTVSLTSEWNTVPELEGYDWCKK